MLSNVKGVDTLEDRLSILRNEAQIQKSNCFQNRAFVFNENGNDQYAALFAKKHSVIGSKLGIYDKQCEDFVKSALTDLWATGCFTKNDFTAVTMPLHSLAEYNFNGGAAKVDFDTDEPGFMEPDARSINGWASVATIRKDTSIIKKGNRYKEFDSCRNDSVDVAPAVGLTQYRSLFTGEAQYRTPEYYGITPRSISGSWILCPDCSLVWQYQTPYLIDTTDAASRNLFFKIERLYRAYVASGNRSFADSASENLAVLLHISEQEAAKALRTNKIALASACWQPEFDRDTVPQLMVHVPRSKDTIVLGRDLYLPFLVTQINTTNEVRLEDAKLPAGIYRFRLWDKDKAPAVNQGQVSYLDSGVIPPNTEVWIKLAYNPRLLNFYRGFKLDELGRADTLQVDVRNMITLQTLHVPLKQADKHQVIYANPSNGTITIEADEPGKLQLQDQHGEKRGVLEVKPGLNHYQVSQFGTGVLYMEQDGVIIKVVINFTDK